MRGGMTSGILYPPAIYGFAEEYTLVGIGGTSAGGIAAGIAAAAEYRRRNGGGLDGFDRLKDIPIDLEAEGKLTGLFRADASTRKILTRVLKLQRKYCGAKKPGLLSVLNNAWWAKRNAGPMRANNYGICTGMANGNPTEAGEIEPLTPWLHALIQDAAGLPHDRPLTFGDLHSAPRPEPLDAISELPGDRSIDLRLVTSCLSYHRPVELPSTTTRFGFRVEEWSQYFPGPVVEHLKNAAGEQHGEEWPRDGILQLTLGENLPIIVAIRLSLSFPLLFSMVPAFVVNRHTDEHPTSRIWFSDGGITSNFPIHRFDSLFPRWPTFGINLKYSDRHNKITEPDARGDFLHLPSERTADRFGIPHDFIPPANEASIFDLVGLAKDGIFASAQNWHDNSFLQFDTFSDRVVDIWLRKDEGGTNLEMSSDTIRDLAARGRAAADLLRDRFRELRSNQSMSWDGHRWARFITGMAGTITYLRAFRRSTQQTGAGERTLSELVALGESSPAYPAESALHAEEMADALQRMLDGLAKPKDYQSFPGLSSNPYRALEGVQPQLGLKPPF